MRSLRSNHKATSNEVYSSRGTSPPQSPSSPLREHPTDVATLSQPKAPPEDAKLPSAGAASQTTGDITFSTKCNVPETQSLSSKKDHLNKPHKIVPTTSHAHWAIAQANKISIIIRNQDRNHQIIETHLTKMMPISRPSKPETPPCYPQSRSLRPLP